MSVASSASQANVKGGPDRGRTVSALAMAVFRFLARYPIILLCIALMVLFSVTSQFFLTVFNLANILYESSLVGILALGLTPLIISGNLDLSVGSMLGLASCLVVGFELWGLALSVLIALGCGVAIGLVNGFIVEKIGINSLIATLAAMIGVKGLAFLYAGETSMSATSDDLLNFGAFYVGPIHIAVIFFVVIAAALHVVLTRTPHGRNTFAIGGNRAAAVDAGIPVMRTVIINFALAGALAALSGIVMAANLGAATPTFGTNYELWAITSVVLGGTSLRGGAGSVLGTLAAAITLSVLRNGLSMLQVQPFYIPIIMGSALILALLLDLRLNTNKALQGE
jgi:ribose transport system permease protein